MASGLNTPACTPSLNFETCFSISSAEKLSDTLQPVSSVSAPRLAPPEMKRRRVRSGSAFTASLTSNFLSTPGIRSERLRPMTILLLASDDHRAQALRHQDREHDMHHHESDDRRHAEEVDIACGLIAAEQCREPLQLHRLPHREARQHNDDANNNDAGVEQLLHVI